MGLWGVPVSYEDCRRKFRSQTSDNMDRWKAEQGRGREKRKIRRKKSRRKKMQMRERVGKSRNTVFFQWFGAPEGRKVGSLKRRVRSQLARWEMKNCTPLWREAHVEVKRYKTPQRRTTFGSWEVEKIARRCGAKHISKSECTKHTSFGPLLEVQMSKKVTPLWREAHFQVKMHKTHQLRTTFGSWDVEKVHSVVARSTFPSQNVQNTPAPDHFWQLRCRKSARRCGAKHISKSKCTKHHMFAPLLEVRMLKKCTPLWREAHFEVKMHKTHHVRTIFGGSEVVSRGRRKGLWTLSKVSKTWRFCSIFNHNYHYTTLHSNTLHYTTTTTTLHYILLHYTPLHYTALNYIQLHYTLHYTTLHYTTLRYTTLHYTTLHYLPLHYITAHYTPLHYTTLHHATLHYTPLHYTSSTPTTTLHYTKLHYTTLHYTTYHNTPLHYITIHYTTYHNTPLHYITLHYITLNDTAPRIDRYTDRQIDR